MLLTGVQPIVIKSKEQKALEAMQREQEAIKAQAAEKLRKEKLRKKKDGALKVITQRSVDNSRSDVKKCEKHLETAQLE